MRRTRAYRRHQRARIRARHLRDHRARFGRDVPPPKDLATRHPIDCGGRCQLCHGGKLLGLPSLAEVRQRQRDTDEWV